MAKTIATIMGIAFILVGLVGFISDNFLGTHLSMTHNLIHLISGAVALYLGLKGSLSAARLFCLAFGAVYLLLGVAGFLFNSGTNTTLPDALRDGGTNNHMLHVLPGALELGTMDHIVHILIGLVFLIGGFLTRADVNRATDARV
ncbi:MAG: DUF4383 domain-containing protein [Acidobacteriota bacterium]|nr:DUF4383 domain-containing protein [Acidobacteriota bacterium]